jgi:ABC-2 type transport system ATP-binding protein
VSGRSATLIDPRLSGAPLQVEGFGRRYRSSRPWAVRSLTFAVPEGAITALVGPNGAGKSTLIRACLGFERPSEGRILIRGIDPQDDAARAIASIGYVAQSPGLYRGLTIGDHFTFARAGRSSFDADHARAHLAAVGLDLRRRLGELSGGEQAQVALALALGTRAPLLLLDEPLAGLDPLARRDFLRLLVADVRARGATVLLSSHIISDVEDTCDRVVVLAAGQLRLDASVVEAKSRFRTVPLADVAGLDPVGVFAGLDGAMQALVADAEAGRPASLEEIVLGHLASGRTAPGIAA